MSTPLVSVCIPTYLGAPFLGKTIESVLNQTYSNIDIWILDDNSPDETQSLVARYSDSRIKYVKNQRNLGPEGNWNRCLDFAHGKYYKLLPHDDTLAIDCLEKQVAVLEADKAGEIALVFGSRHIIAPNGDVLMTRGLPRAKSGRIDGIALIKRAARSGANPIGEPGNGLIRSDLIKKVGLYDARHPYLVDLDYWCRTLLFGDGYYTGTQTSSFRVSEGSWSVAIGAKQHLDFKGFLGKLHADPRYKISRTDRAIGLARARLNTLARSLVYRHLFFAK